jgi:hypothetical protein
MGKKAGFGPILDIVKKQKNLNPIPGIKHRPLNPQVATLLSGLSCLISHVYIYTHSEDIKDTHTALGLTLIIIMNISG